eukprot:10455721-Alexandrium_andersonii.AAC.1
MSCPPCHSSPQHLHQATVLLSFRGRKYSMAVFGYSANLGLCACGCYVPKGEEVTLQGCQLQPDGR